MSIQEKQSLKIFFLVLFIGAIMMVQPVAGKSVYLSANHHTGAFDAWNIDSDGLVSYQATYTLNHALEPAGIAIDAVTGEGNDPLMFVTSEGSYGGVEVINPVTLAFHGVGPGPGNMGGVDVDDIDNVFFAIQRGTSDYVGIGTSELYIYGYNDDGSGITQLAHITLPNHGYGMGLALDDARDILWVGDIQYSMVKAYDVNVSDWNDIAEIPTLSFTVSHSPIDVAVDSKRNLVYTVAGWAGSTLLSKYDVDAEVETTTDCGAGMGIAVDEITGYVYMTRGGLSGYYPPSHDDIAVWDCSTSPFTLLQETPDIGNPAGIAIGNVSYNPLNLAKNDVVVGYGIYVGQEFTYEITSDNTANAFDVTGVTIVDNMPPELDFVSESVGGVPGTGVFDAPSHTVTWDIGTIPAGQAGPLVELVVEVNESAIPNTTIYNYCTIESDQTPPTTVIGDDPDDPNPSPGSPVVPVPFGCVAGYVTADCPAPGSALLGVVIDVNDGNGDLTSAVTDANGYYEICDILAGDHTVTIVTPLGYYVSPEEQPVTVVGGETANVDFALTCVEITASPRTIGFWKHQIGVATGGKGKAQIDAPTLCSYLDLIENHFNGNAINEVIVYQPPISGLCEAKLPVLKSLMNLKGSVDMIDRAKQQLMALLLNVAGGKLSQTEIISADGATVSQAITYCDNLIDDPAGDHEMAKTICDEINNNREVAAGMIPLSTVNIAYKQGGIPVTYALSQNYPNPFNPTTGISFTLPQASDVKLEIYNIMGQRVAALVDGHLEAGEHVVQWNASDVASGVYFYRLHAGEFTETRKMMLLK